MPGVPMSGPIPADEYRSQRKIGRAPMHVQQLRQQIDKQPRYRLAHRPTPLEAVPRFSKAVGGPSIFIKRDDCTGLAIGGNKARHNEFVLAEALRQGADLFVWGGSVQ